MSDSISLFDTQGNRKYLNEAERLRFAEAVKDADREIRTFCHVMLYTGCRVSEALAVTARRVDYSDQAIIFESLKKRRKGIFRAVPVPSSLLDELDLVHELRKRPKKQLDKPLWPFSRQTGYTWVKDVMNQAGIEGIHATPKGLRHSFGVLALKKGVQLNMLQKWMGHASLSTTAIYANAIGEDEREVAKRMW